MGRSGCSARASPCCSSFCSFSAISSGKSRTHRGMAVAPRRHIRPLHALEPGTALEAGALVHMSIEAVEAKFSSLEACWKCPHLNSSKLGYFATCRILRECNGVGAEGVE